MQKSIFHWIFLQPYIALSYKQLISYMLIRLIQDIFFDFCLFIEMNMLSIGFDNYTLNLQTNKSIHLQKVHTVCTVFQINEISDLWKGKTLSDVKEYYSSP